MYANRKLFLAFILILLLGFTLDPVAQGSCSYGVWEAINYTCPCAGGTIKIGECAAGTGKHGCSQFLFPAYCLGGCQVATYESCTENGSTHLALNLSAQVPHVFTLNATSSETTCERSQMKFARWYKEQQAR